MRRSSMKLSACLVCRKTDRDDSFVMQISISESVEWKKWDRIEWCFNWVALEISKPLRLRNFILNSFHGY